MPKFKENVFVFEAHLVQLLLSGGKFSEEVDTDINSRQDRVDNLQVCLSHLKSSGVDLTAIDAEGKYIAYRYFYQVLLV